MYRERGTLVAALLTSPCLCHWGGTEAWNKHSLAPCLSFPVWKIQETFLL